MVEVVSTFVTCCKERYAAPEGRPVRTQGKEVYKSSPAQSYTPPSSFALTQKLSRFVLWFMGVDVDLFLHLIFFFFFLTYFDHSYTQTSAAQIHTQLFLLLQKFSFCIYDGSFYSSEAMIIPQCWSQSLLCSRRTVGWLAGDVLHIPWAQDLLLVLFCGCCEIQLIFCVSPGRTRPKTSHSKCIWSRRIVSQNLLVSPPCLSWTSAVWWLPYPWSHYLSSPQAWYITQQFWVGTFNSC